MATDYDELIQVLTHLLTNVFAPKPSYVRGLLGDGLGNVEVPGKPDKNYVRFNRGTTEFFEIFNRTVNPVHDWPVLIGQLPWQPNLTQVVDTDWSAFEQSGWGDNIGATSPHAPTHEWPDGSPGSDPLDVHLRSLVPLRAWTLGTGSTSIYVNSYEYTNANCTGTLWGGVPGLDLSPVMSVSATATGTARFMGVFVNPSTNTLGVVTGSIGVFSDAVPPPLVQFPAGVIPSARIRVYGGQTHIREADIFDARRPFGFCATGTVVNAVPSGLAGGDLTGTYPNPQVAGLYGYSLLSTAPSEGDVLMFTGSAWRPVKYDDKLTVQNSSVAAVVAGDIGYLDEAGEFQTTTDADSPLMVGAGCVVKIGGANGAKITVATSGVHTVNYTGSAPAKGNFLTTSMTAGKAQGRSTMHPAVFAVCTAAGSGGRVAVILHFGSQPVPYTSSNNLYRSDNHSSSIWTGTINGTPTTTNVPISTSTGNVDALTPAATTELAKLMLYNITRGTYRLVTAYAGGNITTVASSDSWDDTDNLTIANAVIGDALTERFVGFDLSQQTEIPVLTRSIKINTTTLDSGGAGAIRQFHPYESYVASKIIADNATNSTSQIYNNPSVPLIDQKFGKREVATGSGTKITIINITQYVVATP